MPRDIIDDMFITNIANDRFLSDLCVKWFELNKKEKPTDIEKEEKEKLHKVIIQFHKDNYENTEYDE